MTSTDYSELVRRLRYADQDLDHGKIAKVKETCWEAHIAIEQQASTIYRNADDNQKSANVALEKNLAVERRADKLAQKQSNEIARLSRDLAAARREKEEMRERCFQIAKRHADQTNGDYRIANAIRALSAQPGPHKSMTETLMDPDEKQFWDAADRQDDEQRHRERQMTDTVMISRASLQHVTDALDKCKAEVDEALRFPSSPPPPSDTVAISRSLLEELTDDLNAHLDHYYSPEVRAYPSEEAKYQRDMEPVNRARVALSSSPPPSGLREALIAVLEAREEWEATTDPALEAARYQFFRTKCAEARRLLVASTDDSWVKVDESHPLPHDLQAGDMVKTVKTATVLKRTNDLIWVEAAFSTLGYETMKVEAPTHYRRRPSAEQGG